MSATPPPTGLLAELTHRCPLACPYCSNPLQLAPRRDELDTDTWKRVLREAAALGVLHVHLSGGEPVARRDLSEIVAHCAAIGLYTNLITSGVGLTRAGFDGLMSAGLDHLQLSIQDVEAASADRIGGYSGGYARKREVAQWVVAAGLPLTLNAVIHRANSARAGALVDFAVALGARRVEIAHAQYYGWALRNRAHLMPTREQSVLAIQEVEKRRLRYKGVIVIDHVAPDYHAPFPKPCMNGWGRQSLNVAPDGLILPCHAAQSLPDMDFWSVKTHSLQDAWENSPAFNAFRGFDWMVEPCASCARRTIDFGGCRCQAMALTGSASATDPICSLAPHHALIEAIAADDSQGAIAPDYIYRKYK